VDNPKHLIFLIEEMKMDMELSPSDLKGKWICEISEFI
jgi:hypothetical protein